MIKHMILFLLASPLLLASDLTPEVQKVTLKENYKPHIGILSGFTEPEGNLDAHGSLVVQPRLHLLIVSLFHCQHQMEHSLTIFCFYLLFLDLCN